MPFKIPLNTKMIFTEPKYTSLDQDDGLPLNTPSKTKAPHRFQKAYGLATVLGAAFAGALASAILLWLGAYVWDGQHALHSSPHFVPDFPFKTSRVFNMHEKYLKTTPDWKAAWKRDFMPADSGYVAISNPAQYGLTGGFPIVNTTHTESYTISLFHQLHCLMALRSDTLTLIHDRSATIRTYHNDHCFEYIRQALLCGGDTTLEPVRMKNGHPVHDVDGWGVTHQCKDFDKIKGFAEEFGDGSHEWSTKEDFGKGAFES